MEVEALEEPNHDGGYENHGEGSLQEVLGLFPQKLQDIAGIRESVVGQFHHERDCLALEEGLLEDECNQDRREDSENVKCSYQNPADVREERGHEEPVDGQLGSAGHERRQKDRHLSVTCGGDGSGGHDGRYRTAEAYEHRHYASSGKTYLTQQLVHHEGHAGYVAAVLEKREEEEHGDDDRHEAQNTSHALEDSVQDKALDGRIDTSLDHCEFHNVLESIDTHGQKVLKERANEVEREEEDHSHDQDEHGDCSVLACKDRIDPLAAQALFVLLRLRDTLGAYLPDVGEAHVCHCRTAVEPSLVFHLKDYVLKGLGLVPVQAQLVQDQLVTSDDLACGKADWKTRGIGVVFDQVDYGMEASVDGSAMVVGIAEILSQRTFLINGHVHRMFDELVDTLVLGS